MAITVDKNKVRIPGTKIPGQSREIIEYKARGVSGDDVSVDINPGRPFRPLSVSLHLSAAPTTGTQNFQVNKDDGDNSAYDVVLTKRDLVAGSLTDLIDSYPEEEGYHFDKDDGIDLAWTNTDNVTWGLVFKYELL